MKQRLRSYRYRKPRHQSPATQYQPKPFAGLESGTGHGGMMLTLSACSQTLKVAAREASPTFQKMGMRYCRFSQRVFIRWRVTDCLTDFDRFGTSCSACWAARP